MVIPMYGYLYGYTIAQIELMAIDQPIIVYDHKKNKGKKDKFSSPKKSAMDDAIRRYREIQKKNAESTNSNT